MSGAFSTAKLACSTLPLWSLPTLPIWPSTSPPSFRLSLICAVVLMSIRARSTLSSLAWMLAPPTRSDGVLAVGHPARRAARGAALAEGEHRGAARLGVHEGVGVDRDEQVGLDAARLLDALVQRHEEVGVARQHRAHVRVGVDPVAQQHGDRQHHVLLVQAGRAAGAGILAAVAGIDGDDDEAVDLRLRELRRQGSAGGIAAGRWRRRRTVARSAAPTPRTAAAPCRARPRRRRRPNWRSPPPGWKPPRRRRRRGR